MDISHDAIRKAWKSYLTDREPDFFVTLTFKVRFTDKQATAAVQFFNRSLYKLFPRPARKAINGAVVVERTKRSVAFQGTYHFHFAFCNVSASLPDADTRFRANVIKSAGRLKDRKGAKVSPADRVHIASVYDAEGLADYLTKMGKFPFDRDGLLVWLFDQTGIGHDLPLQESRIWVDTNSGASNALKRRRGAFYSPIPSRLRIREKLLRT